MQTYAQHGGESLGPSGSSTLEQRELNTRLNSFRAGILFVTREWLGMR